MIMTLTGMIPGTAEVVALAVVLSLIFCIEIYGLVKKLCSVTKKLKAVDGK